MDLQDAAVLIAVAIIILCHLLLKVKRRLDVSGPSCILIPQNGQEHTEQEDATTLWDGLDICLPCPPSALNEELVDPFYLPLAPWASVSVLPKVLTSLPKDSTPDTLDTPGRMVPPIAIATPAPPSPARRPPPTSSPSLSPPRRCPSPIRPVTSGTSFSRIPVSPTGLTPCSRRLTGTSSQRGHVRRASLDVPPATGSSASSASTTGSISISRLPQAPGCGASLPRPLASSPRVNSSSIRPPRSPVAAAKLALPSPRRLQSPRQQPQPACCKVAPVSQLNVLRSPQQRLLPASCKASPLPLPPPPPRTPLQHRPFHRSEQIPKNMPLEVQKSAGCKEQAQRKEQHRELLESSQRGEGEQLGERGSAASGLSCYLSALADAGAPAGEQQMKFTTPRAVDSADPPNTCESCVSPFTILGASPSLRRANPTSVLLRAAEIEARSKSSGGANVGGTGPFTPGTPPPPSRNPTSSRSLLCSFDSLASAYSLSLLSDESIGHRVRVSIGGGRSSCGGSSGSNSNNLDFDSIAFGGLSGSGVCSAGGGSSSSGRGSSGGGSVTMVSTSTRLFSSTGGGSSSSCCSRSNDRAGMSGKIGTSGMSFLAFARATQMDALAGSPPVSPAKADAQAEASVGMVNPKVPPPPLGKRLAKPNMPRISGL